MSSSNSPTDDTPMLVPFVAQAGDATTQIFVIDGRFNLVTKGLGYLETQLPPGMYKVKFKAGTSIHEVHQAVRRGLPQVRVTLPQGVKFDSAAPINDTATSHEYHQMHASMISREVHASLGTGSGLFVFARDYLRESAARPLDVERLGHPATGLTLHDLPGKLLVDFTTLGKRRQDDKENEEKDNWAGASLLLAPGTYRLRVDMGELGVLEQSVVTCPGWQTQVFLLRRDYGREQVVRRADLSGASILMSRLERGFEPYLRSLRLTEMARQGLENGRAVVSDDVLRATLRDQSMQPVVPDAALEEMLYGKYENPMLGIYGAHLLLQAEEKHDLLRTVVTNLHKLVGDEHPDVMALDLWLGEQQNVRSFSAPPMLLSSWNIVLEASVRQPDIVPPESLSAQVAPNLWGTSAWLVWRKGVELVPMQESRPFSITPVSLFQEVAPLLMQSGSVLRATDRMARVMGLNAIEADLLGHLAETVFAGVSPALKPDFATVARFFAEIADAVEKCMLSIGPDGTDLSLSGKEGDPQHVLRAAALVRSLRVPRALVDSAIGSLVSKLDSLFFTRKLDLPQLEAGFKYLFDNTAVTFKDWRFVGEGAFVLRDGAMQAQPGGDFGVLYYTGETFGDFILRLQFRLSREDDDSGVFVRFRDPLQPVPDRNNPFILYPYDKQQWVAVHTGFEVQIDELARGNSGGLDEHRTGAIYDMGQQGYMRGLVLEPGVWYEYEIAVVGQTYTVRLNGMQTAVFTNHDAFRGKPPAMDRHSGYLGLQSLSGQVAFRTIRVKPL